MTKVIPVWSANIYLSILLFGLSMTSAALAQSPATEDASEIPEIIVQSDPLGGTDEHFSTPTTILHGDQLEQASMRSIGEAVSEIPGVTSSDFGAAVSRPVIRGLGGNRVRVLEDGIGSMDVSTVSGDHAVSTEPIFADQIEVIRGPATLLYGTGASGGIVNVVSNRIKSELPERRRIKAYTHIDTASEGWLSAFDASTGIGNNFTVTLDGLWRSTGDVDIPGFASLTPDDHDESGTLPNSNAESSAFGGGASWIGSTGYLGFHISQLDNDYGVPGTHGHEEEEEGGEEEEEEEEEERGVRLDIEQTRYDVRGGWRPNLPLVKEIKGSWGYNDYEHAESESPSEIGTVFDNEEWEGRIEAVLQPMGRWQGALGVQFGDREFEVVGEEAYITPSEVESIAVFLLEKTDFGNVHVDVGFRYEHQKAETENDAQDSAKHNLFAFSLGTIYTYSDGYEAGFSASRTERAPTIEELFASGGHLATNTFEIGDANLDEETSNNFDIFWRKTSGRLRLDVSFFYNMVDDFVYLALNDGNNNGIADRVEADFLETGEIHDDEEDELLLVNQSQTDADFWGFELAGDWNFFDDQRGRLDMRMWSDWVEGELDDGSNVPRMTSARFGSSLSYMLGPWDMSFRLTHVFDQNDTAELETETDGYTLLNLYASYTWALANDNEISVFAHGKNLADEEIRRHTSFVKDISTLAGVSGLFGIRAKF